MTAGHVHVNAPAANVGVGINGSKEDKDKMHVDTDLGDLARSKETPQPDTTTNASTAPDSPLTETSSILSELPEGDGDDEDGHGHGGKDGDEMPLKGRPRRAVRDGVAGEFFEV